MKTNQPSKETKLKLIQLMKRTSWTIIAKKQNKRTSA
jgi:hypothetical protein